MMYYYRGTKEFLDDFCPNENDVNNYISNIEIVKINNIMVDINVFTLRRWFCDRFQCTYHANPHHCGTCCGGGGIVSPLNEKVINLYKADTYKYLNKEKIDILKNGNICQSKYKLNSENGTCIFLSTLSEDYFCALHKVALDYKIPVFSVKSFDCCIEPMEIIATNDGTLFVTIITESNCNISRWGNVLPCVIMPFDDAPLLIESMKYNLICLFGIEFYDKLKHEVNIRRESRDKNANDCSGLGLSL